MYIYFISVILFISFGTYLYFQSKVKKNQNFPAIWAITIGVLVYTTNTNIKWIIENINQLTSWQLVIPESASTLKLIIFLSFLILITWIFYRFKFLKNNTNIYQKNIFMNLFHFGNIEQNNAKK